MTIPSRMGNAWRSAKTSRHAQRDASTGRFVTKTTRRASASRTEVQQPRPKQLTVAEARRLFDDRARELTGMSGEEFRREYEAGRLDRENSNVLRLAMLRPFGR